MKVQVSVPQVIVRDSNLKNKDGSFAVEQTVLLVVEGKLAPIESTVILRAGAKPFDIGTYEVDPASFSAGQYGRVDFRLRVGAKVVPASVSKAA